MLIYAVTSFDKRFRQEFQNVKNVKANNLFSFYDKTAVNQYSFIKSISKNILIDSGAFSIFNSNPNVNFDKYFEGYCKFVESLTNDEIIKGFFELDIGALISYEKVLYYRNRLDEVSDKIIPVWHLYLGVEEFKKMVQKYDYISIGGIVSKEINKNKLAPYVKYAHKHNTKIHGLGITTQKILDTVPFDSVDSSSWLLSRFGQMYCFDKGKSYAKKIKSKYISDGYGKINVMSYLNFLKFQEYYYNKWKFYHND